MAGSVVQLQGLDGTRLWGFLSAVGVLRCYADIEHDTKARLSWDDAGNPLYHFDLATSQPDMLSVLQGAAERFAGNQGVAVWGGRTAGPTGVNKQGAVVGGKGFGKVNVVVGSGGAEDYESVSVWNPWATIRAYNGEAVYAPARWARNSPNNIVFDLHQAVDEAVSVLTGRGWTVDKKLGKQPLNSMQIETRWAEITGKRSVLLSRDWKGRTGVPAPKEGAASLFLMDYRSRHAYGVESTEPPDKKGRISTKPSFQYAPAVTFLVGMGLLSVAAYGGKMPGESSAEGGPSDTRMVRWALWRQPLPLSAITYLLWHPGLDFPRAEGRRLLCGGHPSPLHAAALHQAEGAKDIAPSIRTRTRKVRK